MPEARFHVAAKQVSGRYALLVWSAKSTRFDAVEGADSFVIENGKIVFQSIHYGLTQRGGAIDNGVTEGPQTR
ncbi:hypothetical protein CIT31_13225 [Mesorhizobium wenxiniae]|uniref:Uncharacterized protein n=1 Tax=Mesorhizobium wenxiniae TaxID=2014805 RepID=A0A271KGX1_9HYPH|nr:hypothetical protein CIT31_13225 [Mesorhizobium wenxiniae]